jgi:hypothetical protein
MHNLSPADTPRLIYQRRDPLTPWQWHAAEPWFDQVTGQPTSYLAGLPTYASAASYGQRHGWPVPPEDGVIGRATA